MSAYAGYLLCGTPRTGSTLLCSLLTSTGVLGRPRSWFREPDEAAIAHELGVPAARDRPADYRRYVDAVSEAGRTPNGVFAARIMWGSLDHVVRELGGGDQTRDIDVIQGALGQLAVIHLRRNGIVGQAVSWHRAEQTGYWQHGDTTHAEPRQDLGQCVQLVHTIHEHEAAWRDWFHRNDVQPLELTYEALVDDMAEAVSKVASHLGIAIPGIWRPQPQETRQADDINNRWATALRAALDTGDSADQPLHPRI